MTSKNLLSLVVSKKVPLEIAMKVLDCTLRDGGYYNNWNFSKKLVEEYLSSCHQSGIDFVELGLRTPPSEKFKGAYAYTTEGHVNSLSIPDGLSLGVMINAKDFIDENNNLRRYFLEKKQSKISLVRIAAHFNEIESSLILVNELKDLGYIVGLNLMQIGVQTKETIESHLKLLKKNKELDVLYFADSLGNMEQKDVEFCISLIKNYFPGDIGIHAHNNLDKALANSLHALELGATWLDSTITGMGRGAGNTQTEYLLYELNKMGHHKYLPESLFPLVLKEFMKLKDYYKWGSSLLYYLAAKEKIHPSFIQQMANNDVYDYLDQLNAVKALSRVDSTKYRGLNIMEILHNKNEATNSEDLKLNISENQEVLILANGPKLGEYIDLVEDYIKKNNPFVISLNINNHVEPSLVNLYSFCNPARILTNVEKISNLSADIIIPLHQLSTDLHGLLKNKNVLNYNLSIKDEISFDSKGCTLNSPLVLGYTLCAMLSQGNSREIKLAGFDGYKNQSHKNSNVNELLDSVRTLDPNISIHSIIPSAYSVDHQSLFSAGMIHEI